MVKLLADDALICCGLAVVYVFWINYFLKKVPDCGLDLCAEAERGRALVALFLSLLISPLFIIISYQKMDNSCFIILGGLLKTEDHSSSESPSSRRRIITERLSLHRTTQWLVLMVVWLFLILCFYQVALLPLTFHLFSILIGQSTLSVSM